MILITTKGEYLGKQEDRYWKRYRNRIKKESEYLNCEKKKKPKEYIIKEAELLVSDYLNGMERKKEEKKQKEIEKRYKKLKKICTILTFIIFISMLVHFL